MLSLSHFVPVNPTTGEPLLPVADSGPAEVDEAVRAAQRALHGEWSRNGRLRAEVLARWADALEQAAAGLEEDLIAETGKVRREARAEVKGAVDSLRYNSGMSRLVGGHAGPLPDGSVAHVERQPVGVCAFITPWNWPVLLLLRDLAPALAAGVTAVVKPAPQTAHVTARVVELGRAAGVPEGVVAVVPGQAAVGEALVTHPEVRGVSFTGSSAVGAEILRSAAGGFKRVLLELGGKGASVVFADADIGAAVAASVSSAMTTSGQMCLACTRVLAHRSVFAAVRDAVVDRVRALRVGSPGEEGSDLGPLISAQHRERVLSYVELARSSARVECGGDAVQPDGAPGWFMTPAVVTDVAPGSALVRDEIFGPVLTVEAFDGEDEAVESANSSPYGLVAAVWTGDVGRAWRVARRLDAGTVWVNNYGPSYAEIPTGGFKHSGLGRTRGIEGIEQFTEIKHINWTPR